MIPSVTSVVQMRLLLTALIRVLAILLWALSLLPLVWWLADGLAEADIFYWRFYKGFIVSFCIIALAGAVLFMRAPWLSERLIPMKYLSCCPRCQHPIASAPESRCTECGLVLPQDFLDQLSMDHIDYRAGVAGPKRISGEMRGALYTAIVVSSFVTVLGLLILLTASSRNANAARRMFIESSDGFGIMVLGMIMLLCAVLAVLLTRRK